MGDASGAADEFIAAFNSHDPARIRAGYAENVRFIAPDAQMEGADAATEYPMAFIRAFPDMRIRSRAAGRQRGAASGVDLQEDRLRDQGRSRARAG